MFLSFIVLPARNSFPFCKNPSETRATAMHCQRPAMPQSTPVVTAAGAGRTPRCFAILARSPCLWRGRCRIQVREALKAVKAPGT